MGRLIEVKRVDVLIDAFKALAGPVYAAWSLDIVGDGPMASTLRARAGSDLRITFHGACPYPELDCFYHYSDVLVLPSRVEPWGLVVNEALAFGLRVIVSDHVGSVQLVTEDTVGARFPTGDVASLSARMRDSQHHLDRRPLAPTDPTAEMRDDLDWLAGRQVDDR